MGFNQAFKVNTMYLLSKFHYFVKIAFCFSAISEVNPYFCTMKAEELLEKDLRVGLYLCTQGTCNLSVNDKPCHITYGNVLIKSPLVQLENIESSDDFEFTPIIEDDIEYFAPIASDNIDIIQDLLRMNKFDYNLGPTHLDFLLRRKELIDERKRELAQEGISTRQQKLIENIIVMMEQITVLEYAKILLSRNSVHPSKPEKEDNILVKFIFLLFRHYKRHRQVSFYADALRISPNHFTRIIKKVSGHTPSEWIILGTINQAKKLLRRKNIRVKDVAQELRFPEQFTFRKYFKQHTGLSPLEYKKKNSL